MRELCINNFSVVYNCYQNSLAKASSLHKRKKKKKKIQRGSTLSFTLSRSQCLCVCVIKRACSCSVPPCSRPRPARATTVRATYSESSSTSYLKFRAYFVVRSFCRLLQCRACVRVWILSHTHNTHTKAAKKFHSWKTKIILKSLLITEIYLLKGNVQQKKKQEILICNHYYQCYHFCFKISCSMVRLKIIYHI